MTFRRVLVTGSRNWDNEQAVRSALVHVWITTCPDRLVLVHGACPEGADAIAEAWARAMWQKAPEMIDIERHPADWVRLGTRAGPHRNTRMVGLGAELCLAFIGPCVRPRCRRSGAHGSHGATDCARKAEQAGIPTYRWLRLAEQTLVAP